MTMSTSLACCGVQLGGLAVEVLAHLLGVAGRAGSGVLDLDPQELRAHRLHLLADLGAGIERPHDRAQAARGADRGQAGHTGADDQDLGRRDLARGGDLAGEERAELVGGLDDGAVAADVGHRAQHVQGLCPRDARNRVHGQGGDATGRQGADEVGVQGGGQQADQRLTGLQALHLVRRGGVDLQDDLAVPHLAADDLGSRRAVGGVVEGRPGTRAGLDGHVISELDDLLDGLGGGGYPAFTGLGLLGHTDAHDSSSRRSGRGRTYLLGRGGLHVGEAPRRRSGRRSRPGRGHRSRVLRAERVARSPRLGTGSPARAGGRSGRLNRPIDHHVRLRDEQGVR